MQKMTKGAIAAAAAALLLVGGGGTFMSWNQDDTVSGAMITAGTLTLDTTADAVWYLNGKEVSIISAEIVPGDILEFTQAVEITATGDYIAGELSVKGGSISPVDSEKTADSELATALTAGPGTALVIKDAGDEGLSKLGDAIYSFQEAGNYSATVSATFDFGLESVEEAMAQGGEVTMDNLAVSLQQARPLGEGENPGELL